MHRVGGRRSAVVGARAERLAACFLELEGLEILDHNRRAEGGEIDLLAREGKVLAFVEVRLRSHRAWVSAAASVDARKRARLRACARGLLRRREDLRWPGRRLRFDLVLLERAPGRLRVEHLRAVRL